MKNCQVLFFVDNQLNRKKKRSKREKSNEKKKGEKTKFDFYNVQKNELFVVYKPKKFSTFYYKIFV